MKRPSGDHDTCRMMRVDRSPKSVTGCIAPPEVGRIHTSLVAPINIGDRAYTGAGSAITEDVPEGALAIARQRQKNIEGYADRKEQEDSQK